MSAPARIPPLLRSLFAFLSAILIVVVLSTASDAVLTAIGAFEAGGRFPTDAAFLIAGLYRAIYALVGGYIVTMLAPRRTMAHAWILGGLGTVIGIAGVVAYFAGGAEDLGPPWYALSIPLTALPCTLLGARIRLSRRAS